MTALCTETFGRSSDPAMLLIHGAGQSMLAWDDELCERLGTGGRFVIRYDARDAGRSPTWPLGEADYGLPDLVLDAVSVLDACDTATAHVVGMSVGAAIGQLLAVEHAERVASLALTGGTPGGPGHETPDLPGFAPELDAYFATPAGDPDWTDRDAVIEYLVEGERPFAARSRPFDADAMRATAAREVDRANDIAAQMTNSFRLGVGPPWRDRLAEIRAPTLVLHGAEDPLFPLAHGEALAREIPGARLLALDGTGHEIFPRHTWDVVVPALLDLGTRAAER